MISHLFPTRSLGVFVFGLFTCSFAKLNKSGCLIQPALGLSKAARALSDHQLSHTSTNHEQRLGKHRLHVSIVHSPGVGLKTNSGHASERLFCLLGSQSLCNNMPGRRSRFDYKSLNKTPDLCCCLYRLHAFL